ncbi:hypothetical protein DdX_21635 [Ditylenchus destructor]|uniref:histidine kinase n=1 Tax=Ditylenchus destructor TaxID=166010 RepID=A0AAD4MEP8_9BILA|nr:hypothetical protein DdX_21635 [Ditylenchus destructor]
MEFELLWLLASSAGKILSRDDILNRMRGDRLRRAQPQRRRVHQQAARQAQRQPPGAGVHQDHLGQGLPVQSVCVGGLDATAVSASVYHPAIGLAGAIWLVNYTFDELLPEANETYNREALRGPAYGLVEQLRPVKGDARAARLAELQPHYGLRLALVQRDQLAMTEREKQLLATGNCWCGGTSWSSWWISMAARKCSKSNCRKNPSGCTCGRMASWACAWRSSCISGFGPIGATWSTSAWRRNVLATTTSAHASCCRAPSTVRELAGHFNQMADRIESLISNQRELTNAVSHELRTPIARCRLKLDQLKQQADPRQSRALIEDMYATSASWKKWSRSC